MSVDVPIVHRHGRRWVVIGALGVAAIVAAAVIFTQVARWHVAGGLALRDAVAIMDQPPPSVPGRNGFGDLMLATFAVAPAQVDAALAADVRSFVAHRLGYAQPWGPFAGMAQRPSKWTPCALHGGCYARIADDVDAFRTEFVDAAARLRAVERSLAAPVFRSPYPESIHAPSPAYQLWRMPLEKALLDAHDGDVNAGYSGACRTLAGLRRINRQSTAILEKAVAAGLANVAAMQLLEMRRRFPVDALPADCAVAIAPAVPAEVDLCEPMRGEFRAYLAEFAEIERGLSDWRPLRIAAAALWFDRGISEAWLADSLRDACAAPRLQRALRGERTETRLSPVRDGLECLVSIAGCTAFDRLDEPGLYDDMAERFIDLHAMQRLLFAAQAVADGTATPEDAVRSATLPGHPPHYDAASNTATLSLFQPEGGSREFVVDFAGLAPRSDDSVRPAGEREE